MLDLKDGSVVKDDSCQTWWSEFDCRDPWNEGENRLSEVALWPPPDVCALPPPINKCNKKEGDAMARSRMDGPMPDLGQLLTSLDANEWCKECQARLDSFIRSFIHPFIHLCFVLPARVCWVCRWGWHPSLLSPCWTQRAAGVLLTSFVVVNYLTELLFSLLWQIG